MAKLSLIVDSAQGEQALRSFAKTTEGVTVATEKTTLGMGKLVRGLAAIGIAYKTYNLARESLRAADEAERASRLFAVAFDNIGDRAAQWAKTTTTAFRMQDDEIKRAAARFQILFENMGVGQETAFEMTRGLTELGSTLIRLYPDAFERLASGMAGNTRGLREMGIQIKDTEIEQYALNQGWIRQGETLSEAGRAYTTYRMILEQSDKAMRAASGMTDTYGEQIRQLSVAWQETKQAIGQGLTPAIIESLNAINTYLRDNQEAVEDWARNFAANAGAVVDAMRRVVEFLTSQPVVQAFQQTLDFFDKILGVPGPIDTLRNLQDLAERSRGKSFEQQLEEELQARRQAPPATVQPQVPSLPPGKSAYDLMREWMRGSSSQGGATVSPSLYAGDMPIMLAGYTGNMFRDISPSGIGQVEKTVEDKLSRWLLAKIHGLLNAITGRSDVQEEAEAERIYQSVQRALSAYPSDGPPVRFADYQAGGNVRLAGQVATPAKPVPDVPFVDTSKAERVLDNLQRQNDLIGKSNEEREIALALQEAGISKSHEMAGAIAEEARKLARAREGKEAGKVLEELQFQNELMQQGNDEREVALSLQQAGIDKSHEMAGAIEEEVRKLIEARRMDAAKETVKDLQFQVQLLHAGNEEREVMLALQAAGIDKSHAMAGAIETEVKALQRAQDLRQMADAIGGAFGKAFEDIILGTGDVGDAIDAMLKDILRAIVNAAITKPISEGISNMVMGAFGGGGGGGGGGLFGGLLGWLFHGGGVVGHDAAAYRAVNPLLFLGAPRLHGGLYPGEYPAILRQGETVLEPGSRPNVTVNITNNASVPVTASVRDMKVDLRRMVVGIVLEDQQVNGPITRGINAKK